MWVSEKGILMSERTANANTLRWSIVGLGKDQQKGPGGKIGSSREWSQRGSHEQNNVELCNPCEDSGYFSPKLSEMPLKSCLEDSLCLWELGRTGRRGIRDQLYGYWVMFGEMMIIMSEWRCENWLDLEYIVVIIRNYAKKVMVSTFPKMNFLL